MKRNLVKNSFFIHAFIFWLLIGIPGIIVTVYFLNTKPQKHIKTPHRNESNTSHSECHEVKKEWKEFVSLSQYAIQGKVDFSKNILRICLLGINCPHFKQVFSRICYLVFNDYKSIRSITYIYEFYNSIRRFLLWSI